MENKRYVKSALLVGLKLLLICAVVAGVVSFVFSATIDAYNKNIENEMRLSMATIFGAGENDVIEYTASEVEGGTVYAVTKNGENVGYCVQLLGNGFGGEISLMVGFENDRSIRGVSVISHGETPGVGDKATKEDHLSQYVGKTGDLSISKRGDADITAIANATISSVAIHDAINDASIILRDMLAKEGGAE